MFKIVQTIEKGTPQLTIVPSAWENNSMLYWPKNKADKLIRIGNSTPNDNWFKMKCKLKRNHLINFEIAEEELDRMVDKDDTEQELFENKDEMIKRKSKAPIKQNEYCDDFNSLTMSCLKMTENNMLTPNTISSESLLDEIDENNLYTYEILPDALPCPDTNSNSLLVNVETSKDVEYESTAYLKISQKLDDILTNQATMMETQSENQLAILHQFAKLEAMFDVFAQNQKVCSCKTENSSVIEIKDDIWDPIEDLEKLQKFEDKLADRKVMQDYIHKLSYICGKKAYGLNNCYILVDKIFTRKFFTLCSWAGGARDKKEKIPFKIFKNTINLFFNVSHLTDKEFTLVECEDFFKNIIRNSTRRNESSMTRSSQMKRRPKKKPGSPVQQNDKIVEKIKSFETAIIIETEDCSNNNNINEESELSE